MSSIPVTMAVKMITKIILETILICNRTNKKLQGKLNSFRVGNGNFENSKLFDGLAIFEHNTQPHTTHRISLDLLLSFLSSCLLIFLVFHLVFRVVSRLSSSLSSFSFCPLCLSVCLRVLWCVCVKVCVVRVLVVCVVCVRCVCGVWCVYCVVLWHAEKTFVCKFKTSPCVLAPRTGERVGKGGRREGGHRQFC